MRTINPTATALLAGIAAGQQVPLVQLVRLDLDESIYLTTAGHAIEWGGHTWASGGLGTIEPIEDAEGEVTALQFSLPGVSAEQIAIALTAAVEGKVVQVFDVLVDPATGVVADAVLAWSGTFNVPGLDDGTTATVVVTAEHRGLAALRPKPSRYTHDEQQRRYPGDTSLDIDPATDAGPVVWPAASFFRQ